MISSEDRWLAGWLQNRSHKDSLVSKHIDRVHKLDRERLLANADKEKNLEKGEENPFGVNITSSNHGENRKGSPFYACQLGGAWSAFS